MYEVKTDRTKIKKYANAIIVGDSNIFFSVIYRTSKEKLVKI